MNNELKKIIWNYGDNEYQHIIDNNENEVINFAHYFLVAHSSELIRKSVINKKELNDINYRLLLDTILDIGIYEYSKIVKQYNDISRNIYHNESCIKFVKKIKNEEINDAVSSILKYYNIDQNDLTYANIKNIIESIKNQKTNDDISWYRMIYNQIIKKIW